MKHLNTYKLFEASSKLIDSINYSLGVYNGGDFDHIKVLLDQLDDINIDLGDGMTAIQKATRSNNLDLIIYLLEKGADITLIDKHYRGVFFWLADRSNITIMRFLIDYCKYHNIKPNELDIYSAFFLSTIQRTNMNLVKFFIEECGVSPIPPVKNFGNVLIYVKQELLMNPLRYFSEYDTQKLILDKYPEAYPFFKQTDMLNPEIAIEYKHLDSASDLNLI